MGGMTKDQDGTEKRRGRMAEAKGGNVIRGRPRYGSQLESIRIDTVAAVIDSEHHSSSPQCVRGLKQRYTK